MFKKEQGRPGLSNDFGQLEKASWVTQSWAGYAWLVERALDFSHHQPLPGTPMHGTTGQARSGDPEARTRRRPVWLEHSR